MSAIKGNPSSDFKEQNPIISQVSGFINVYKNNKSDTASKICWSMYMIEEADANNNPLARIIDRKERINEVIKTYYKIDTTTEEYKKLVSDFSKFILTKEESLYRIHVSKFEELTAYLQDLALEKEADFKKYLDIMKGIPGMWKGLEIIKEQMIDSQNKSKVRGNAQLSAREKRKK